MNPTATEISKAMSDFYKGRIIDIILLFAFVVIFCVISFFGVKADKKMRRKNKILISVLVMVCAIGCIVLAAVKFIPVHKDYAEQSYIIATDAEIFVHEQSANNFFDQYDDIELTTASGEKIMLKLYKSNSLGKKETYRGTFVYTVNHKTIIWYSID